MMPRWQPLLGLIAGLAIGIALAHFVHLGAGLLFLGTVGNLFSIAVAKDRRRRRDIQKVLEDRGV
jgi:hypothetical protein